MFYLSEQFFSLQGEGRYAGESSYFLRTALCNMRCSGFGAVYEVENEKRMGCDTYFSVDSAFKSQWQSIEESSALIDTIEQKYDQIGYRPSLVITGGEPLIYAKDEPFYAIVEHFIKSGDRVTFETNGTFAIDFEHFSAYKECTFALSIKLSNSLEPKERRINKEAIKAIATHAKESFFKFTLSAEAIEGGVIEEIRQLQEIAPQLQVYCMPVGESKQTLSQNDKAVFDFCIAHNFTYCDRLHIRIHDTTQGV